MPSMSFAGVLWLTKVSAKTSQICSSDAVRARAMVLLLIDAVVFIMYVVGFRAGMQLLLRVKRCR